MARLDLSDERGIVIGFFLKLFIAFAIFGLAAADGASILFAKLRADDAASAGAVACAAALRTHRGDQDVAIRLGVRAANDKAPGVTVTGVVPTDLGDCTVTTSESAETFVVSKVSFLKDLGEVTATETAQRATL